MISREKVDATKRRERRGSERGGDGGRGAVVMYIQTVQMFNRLARLYHVHARQYVERAGLTKYTILQMIGGRRGSEANRATTGMSLPVVQELPILSSCITEQMCSGVVSFCTVRGVM